MLAPAFRYPGSIEQISITVQATTGVNADPASLVAKTHAPCGKVTTYTYPTSTELTRPDVGVYILSFTPNEAGHWRVRWEATSVDGQVVVSEEKFSVQKSPFVDNDCYRDYC